ncbi:hypothetical protein ABC795_11240 [Blastococcus sp. HT6-30]|uniref:hypothetical protein n=1 Tax=Blastococcus sp. HT6-30 TaxID=3144843 RepID=UPI00321A3FF3
MSACTSVPITTTALEMPLSWREEACRAAADLALLNDMQLVIVGQADGFDIVICLDEECADRPGVIVVVPDTRALLRWSSVPPQAVTMDREDGRSCLIFAGTDPQ